MGFSFQRLKGLNMFNKKEPENGNEKSPLQDEKQEIINEIIDEKEPEKKVGGVKAGTKRGKYKKKPVRKKPVKKTVEPEYTEIQAVNDANFVTALIDEFRTGSGLPPMKNSHKQFFNPSARAMFMKYGSSTAKWMPEIMFMGSLAFIGLDTVKEMRKLKINTKQEKPKKPDLKNFKKIKPGEKTKPSKEL